MINLLYEEFPDSIRADGRELKIVTDFREWLKFADMMADVSLPDELKIDALTQWFIPAPPFITAELLNAVSDFYSAKELKYIRRSDDNVSASETIEKPPVFDWKIDSAYVLGDFRRFYGIDLLTVKYMHWWEFLSLFTALPEDCQCKIRIAYRSTELSDIRNESDRRRIQKIKQQIALPYEYSDETIGDIFNIM